MVGRDAPIGLGLRIAGAELAGLGLRDQYLAQRRAVPRQRRIDADQVGETGVPGDQPVVLVEDHDAAVDVGGNGRHHRRLPLQLGFALLGIGDVAVERQVGAIVERAQPASIQRPVMSWRCVGQRALAGDHLAQLRAAFARQRLGIARPVFAAPGEIEQSTGRSNRHRGCDARLGIPRIS